MTFEEVRAWECDPSNAFHCEECPHNCDASDWQGAYPCGQWHCWVSLNCGEDE